MFAKCSGTYFETCSDLLRSLEAQAKVPNSLAVAFVCICGFADKLGNGNLAWQHRLRDFSFGFRCLSAEVQQGKPVVVDFYATWCGPCWGAQAQLFLMMLRSGGASLQAPRVIKHSGSRCAGSMFRRSDVTQPA